MSFKYRIPLVIFISFLSLSGCSGQDSASERGQKIIFDTLKVTSSAYNSVAAQTTATNPAIAAWGDTLKPGLRAIAISRDLLDSGLYYNQQVFIQGFDSAFYVKDKMNRRWKNKIDVYLGLDVDSARAWGLKELEIYIPIDTISDNY